MKTVGAYEAKTNLGKLLEGVMKGESVTITKHGVPVAVLQTPVSLRKEQPEKVISELKKFREKNTLGSLTIRELIEEGRK
jgi:prevent-host-death family protein